MPADADIFAGEGSVQLPLIGSGALHVALFALALFGYLIPIGRGESWGGTTGGGGAMSATLVSSIPLPRPPTESQNVLANESKGLTEAQIREVEKEQPKAIDIPAPDVKLKGIQKREEKKPPPKEVAKVEDNKIPFGQGGPVSGPYGSFSAGGAKGGLSFTGGTGISAAASAGTSTSVRRKVSENWLKYEVDPRVDAARRVYISRSTSRAQASRRTFRWSSRAACPRWISRRCARCSASTPSARCRRSTPEDKSQWSFGSITGGEQGSGGAPL